MTFDPSTNGHGPGYHRVPVPKRARAVGQMALALLGLFAIWAVTVALWGLLVMVSLGWAHSTDGRVPDFGYWTSCALAIIPAAITTTTFSAARRG